MFSCQNVHDRLSALTRQRLGLRLSGDSLEATFFLFLGISSYHSVQQRPAGNRRGSA